MDLAVKSVIDKCTMHHHAERCQKLQAEQLTKQTDSAVSVQANVLQPLSMPLARQLYARPQAKQHTGISSTSFV